MRLQGANEVDDRMQVSITSVEQQHDNVLQLDWFVFVCRSDSVSLAEHWFQSWTKCECYFPVARKYVYPKRARTDAPAIVERPALGGYLFTRFYEDVNWIRIREQNSHVLQWLKRLEIDAETEEDLYVPATVRNERIEELRRREARGDFDDITPDQKDCALSKTLSGQPVRIPYGQFVGAKGATLDSVWRKICKVKICVLGKDVLLTFPFCDIFPDWDRRI